MKPVCAIYLFPSGDTSSTGPNFTTAPRPFEPSPTIPAVVLIKSRFHQIDHEVEIAVHCLADAWCEFQHRLPTNVNDNNNLSPEFSTLVGLIPGL